MGRIFQKETENLLVEFQVNIDSFSHPFGIKKTTTKEITKISAYVPALDDWVDVSNMSEFIGVAQALIDEEQ